MVLFFLLAFIGIPLIEIVVFLHIGDLIGLWWTLTVVVATAIGGAVMLRVQGIAVLYRAKTHLAKGNMPLREIFDGLCLLTAGALLLTPGFVTDIAGCLLLLQSVRTQLGLMVTRYIVAGGNFQEQPFSTSQVYKNNQKSKFENIIEGEFDEVAPEPTTNVSKGHEINRNR